MRTLTLAPLRSLLTASSRLSSARLHLLFFRSPFSSSSSSRRKKSQQNSYDEESKTIGISVWWDYESCSIPDGVNAYRISNRILSALQSNGIQGPVSINAFGDMRQKIPHAIQEALISTGICLIHAPESGENCGNKLLMADLRNWTTHNPPPAHFFLISSDSVFSNILHCLRMNNYNVLLSCSHNQVKASLYSASTLMWPWISLANGEDFTPLQFNHPPDGMYGSWYGGHQKGLLDDPFEKELMKRVAEMNTTTIPESEVNHIRMAFNTLLFTELNRKNIYREGFKKYLSLTNTMPYADLISLARALKIWPYAKAKHLTRRGTKQTSSQPHIASATVGDAVGFVLV